MLPQNPSLSPRTATDMPSGRAILPEMALVPMRFLCEPASKRGVFHRAILLDRDGVINEKVVGGYVTSWSQFRFVRGIIDFLARMSASGIPLIVVSNQACIGKGLLTRRELGRITRRFVARLKDEGACISAVYYCPHIPEARCRCRKPQPGMLEDAARDFGLDLRSSILIGDSPSDIQAAEAAGCDALALVGSGQAGDFASGCTFVNGVSGLFPALASRWSLPTGAANRTG
jgi:D-glycero-D-manno-heptose 1,7-bisphosphate phosphatase